MNAHFHTLSFKVRTTQYILNSQKNANHSPEKTKEKGKKTPYLNPFFHDYHFIESYENVSIHPNKQLAHLDQMAALPPMATSLKKQQLKQEMFHEVSKK